MIFVSPFRLVFLQIPFISSLNFPPGVKPVVSNPSISKVHEIIGMSTLRQGTHPIKPWEKQRWNSRDSTLPSLKRTASSHLPLVQAGSPKREAGGTRLPSFAIQDFRCQTCEKPIYPRPGAEPFFLFYPLVLLHPH